MKKLLLTIIFLMTTIVAFSQWITKSFTYQNKLRQYRVYISPNYTASNPASMVITLHGLGDNMTNFSQLGFQYIADTANIIVVVPQALSDPIAGTAWNSGAGFMGYYPNSTINDVGFINVLLDSVKAKYSINHSRVYLCGFSMGGFMTNRMALQSNTQFAAFASMSGTIGSGIATYNPGRSVPIAHFHGTADSTVKFIGNTYGIDPDSLISFWIANNGCNPLPDSIRFTDSANDSITIDRFKYSGSTADKDVWFYRMNGADHTVLFQPDNDITEIMEIWMFFRRHTNPTAGIASGSNFSANFQLFPNPTHDFVNILLANNPGGITRVEMFSVQGDCLYYINTSEQLVHINFSENGFKPGIYFIRVTSNNSISTQKFIIR